MADSILFPVAIAESRDSCNGQDLFRQQLERVMRCMVEVSKRNRCDPWNSGMRMTQMHSMFRWQKMFPVSVLISSTKKLYRAFVEAFGGKWQAITSFSKSIISLDFDCIRMC